MKKLIAASALAMGLFAVPAMAADIVSAPEYSWDGFYAGIVGGYTWNNLDVSSIEFEEGGVTTPAKYYGVKDFSMDPAGGTVGGTLGFNYQTGALVLGVEGDISYAWANGSDDSNENIAAFTSEADMNWFGTARLRAGYAFDRALIYATGGFAYGEVEGSIEDKYFKGVTLNSDDSNGMWGWTVGGGLEYAVTDHVTVKAEYLYYDLGETDFNFAEGSPGWENISANVDVTGSVVRAGLNYRF